MYCLESMFSVMKEAVTFAWLPRCGIQLYSIYSETQTNDNSKAPLESCHISRPNLRPD